MADITQLLNSETQIINERTEKINAETTTQKRINQFNNSARKRYEIWTTVIFNIVIGLIVWLVLIFIFQQFPFLPSSLFDLATLIIFSVLIYITYDNYLIIQSRDKLNFDELDLAPMPATPSSIDTTNKINELAKEGDLTGISAANECKGSLCCATGTTWDVTQKKCVPSTATATAPTTATSTATATAPTTATSTATPASGFTTLEQAFSMGEIENNFNQRQLNISSLGKPNILPSLDEYQQTYTLI